MKLRFLSRCALAVQAAAAVAVGMSGCGGNDDPPFEPGKPAAFTPLATLVPANASELDKHMQIARTAWANNSDITAPYWCSNAGQGSNPLLADRSVIPITELFDGFYFVGTVSVGQYVMKTPDGGYVLFDTMNNAADVQNITIPQLQSAGIDPAKLRALIVTHGHGDHDGGVLELQSRFSPATTVVGSADYGANKPYQATVQVNSSDLNPHTLNVAGLTMTALATPGHTPGTTSFILPVTYKGEQHKIAYLGGSAFPGTAAAALQYMRAAETMYQQAKAQKADSSINSHSFEDKTADRIKAIRAQGGIASSNPMIMGTEKVQLAFATLRACSAAQLSVRDGTAKNPVWRPTKVEFYSGGFGGTGLVVAARVSNFFNVISGGEVKFTATDGPTCTAKTDADGVATCTMQAAPGPVTAEFAGLTGSDAIELSSSATRTVR